MPFLRNITSGPPFIVPKEQVNRELDEERNKEIVRSGGWESLVDTCWQDLRYAQRRLRMFIKRPPCDVTSDKRSWRGHLDAV
jgi:hypothetical protein